MEGPVNGSEVFGSAAAAVGPARVTVIATAWTRTPSFDVDRVRAIRPSVRADVPRHKWARLNACNRFAFVTIAELLASRRGPRDGGPCADQESVRTMCGRTVRVRESQRRHTRGID